MASTWHILFVAGIILMVFEVFLPWMIFFPLGLALVMTTPVAWFTDEGRIQVACFLVFSLVDIFVLRRWVRLKRATRSPDSALDYLIGKEALVVQAIDPKRRVGTVRYHNKIWHAVSQMGELLSAGSRVVIMNVHDSKVIVLPKSD